MSITAADTASSSSIALSPPPSGLSFAGLLRSELLKLTSLRSTWWTLGITVVLSVGIAWLLTFSFGPDSGFPQVLALVAPLQFTMLVAGILGAIAITGEYSTGMIRSTLTAQPRRGAVLIAKAIALAAVMAVTSAVSMILSLLVTMPLTSAGIEWSAPEKSWIPLLAAIASMVSFALLGLGWGFIIRNGAGAIAVTIGILFVLPLIISMFATLARGWEWVENIGNHLPMVAAQIITTAGADNQLGGWLAIILWPMCTLLIGWMILRTRDA